MRSLVRVWDALSADRSTLYSLINTARGIIFGPAIAFLIATRFSKNVQGYYYTFSSLVGLQVFVELGLGIVIVQFASHEWAHLSLCVGRVVGAERHRSRLASLLRFSLRWYALVSLAVLVPVSGFGLRFLESAHTSNVSWRGPWLGLCLVSAFRLMLTPAFALLDGCGQIAQTYGFRLFDGILQVASSSTAILCGFQLWTASFVAFCSTVASLVFLGTRYRHLFGSLLRQEVREKVRWKEEVLPMQWRIALSWLSGYFAFQLFTPVLFRYRSPREAGQFGLTWSMVSSINSIGAAFFQTKVPTYGALVASRDFVELDRRALRALGMALFWTLGSSLALLSLLAVMPAIDFSLSERCLGIGPTACLLAATLLLQISNVQSGYLRSFKKEPFLVLSLLFGAITGALAWLLGRHYGAVGIVSGYLATVVLLVLPLGTWIFVRRRREWQAPTDSVSDEPLNY